MAEAPAGTTPAPGRPLSAGARAWALRGLGGRTLLGLALIAAAVAVADRSRLAWDLSADRHFTIDPALVTLVQGLDHPVALTGIWIGPEDVDPYQGLVAQLHRLTELSPRLTWTHIDPELQRPALERFADAHHGASSAGIYLTSLDRIYRIPLSGYTMISVQGEVGAALQALSDPHPPQALVMQGHGELHPGGGADDGIDQLTHDLALDGFGVALQDPATAAVVHASALLVLAGPTAHAFGAEGLAAIRQHLEDGGALLAFLDDRAPPDLTGLLRRYGILVGALPRCMVDGTVAGITDPATASLPPVVVMSMAHNVRSHADEFPFANLLLDEHGMLNDRHPATSEAAKANIDVLSPRTSMVLGFDRAWLEAKDPDQAKGWSQAPATATPLLTTLPGDAWIQPFDHALQPPKALAGMPARGLAWALEYPPAADSAQQGVGARVVIWGSREAVSDGVLGQAGYANGDLVRTMASWSAQRAAPTAIADLAIGSYQAAIGARGLYILFTVLVLVIPLTCLGGAMLTWWDRR